LKVEHDKTFGSGWRWEKVMWNAIVCFSCGLFLVGYGEWQIYLVPAKPGLV
jgi:hypothetical protein